MNANQIKKACDLYVRYKTKILNKMDFITIEEDAMIQRMALILAE